MGCWHKTCALSNLPIFSGEETYVFVLQESDSYSKSQPTYTSYLYYPVLLPFGADYNDYGGGENGRGYAFPLIMDALKKGLIEKEVGENKYHDIAVERGDFGEELFYKAVHEGRLEVNTYDGPKKVSFVMMRKDIIDSILDKWVVEQYKGYDHDAMEAIYHKHKFQDILEDIENFLENCKNIHNSFLKCDENSSFFRLHSMVNLEFWLGDLEKNLVAHWLRRGIGSEGNGSNSIFREKLELANLLADGKFDEAKLLIEVYLKGILINSFMENIRRCWVPPCGEGSQNGEWEPYELLSNIVLDSIVGQRKEWEGE